MASFSGSVSRITQDSAVFRATFRGDSSSSSYRGYRFVRLSIDGVGIYIIKSSTQGGRSSSFTKNITGLSPGRSYRWAARLGYGSQSNIQWLNLTDNGSFRTESSGLRIRPWSWSRSNGEATDIMTKEAYRVLTGQLPADRFSHFVWNDLVNKVDEMRRAKGFRWDTASGKYYPAARCRMQAGSILTAKVFNSVKYNIGTINGTFNDISPGEEIYAHYFTILTDRLNDIINGVV